MHKKITSESESQHCHLLEVVICVTVGWIPDNLSWKWTCAMLIRFLK